MAIHDEQGSAVLPPETHIGQVTLAISQLERSLAFYTNVLGFKIIQQTSGTAQLGARMDAPLLTLVQQEHAQPQPTFSTGLYHFAILVPSRADLGRSLLHLAESRYRLDGYADHLVSEALYLSDPDGNGIEIYRDRPRSEWPWHKGEVAMASDPLDFAGIEEAARSEGKPWEGLQAQTTIGHMHLRVGDIQTAEQFYHGMLGFEIMQRWQGALFVSAGGYHHHIGLNTWQSRSAPRPPQDAIGLRFFSIHVLHQEALAPVQGRLQAAGIPTLRQEEGDNQGTFLALRDPWDNGIVVVAGTEPGIEEVQRAFEAMPV